MICGAIGYTGRMAAQHAAAAGVMIGCLASHAAQRVSNVRRIRVALYVAGTMSRGSAISASENLTAECLERVNGYTFTPLAAAEADTCIGDLDATS